MNQSFFDTAYETLKDVLPIRDKDALIKYSLRVTLAQEINYIQQRIADLDKKYGSYRALAEKISREGVPENDHSIWEEKIVYENLLFAKERIEKVLGVLNDRDL